MTQKKTSYILYPRRCLLSGLALIFLGGELSLTQLLIKTFLSPGRAGGHILPVKLLVSSNILTCMGAGEPQGDLRETSQNLGTPRSLTSFVAKS